MKLSDMFSSLARGAEDLEKRVAEWEKDFGTHSEKMMDSAKSWLASAQERQEELRDRMAAFFADASDDVKLQWSKAESEWEEEVAKLKARGEEMRAKAETMRADQVADWYEAYAARMVAFAQQAQEEASNAVAAAAEKRAKAARDA